MTTSLGSVFTVLGYGLDDHVSLGSVCTTLEQGLVEHVSW